MSTDKTNIESAFYVAGGTLRRDAPSYVERQADQDLYQGLSQGKFCYVLTSRQMGKSSLMVRVAVRLRGEGASVAVLDLTSIGQNLTPEQWYDGLLISIGRQLGLENELEDFWVRHERLAPLQRWMLAISEIVVSRCPGQIVIFVDEIDFVRSLLFPTDEFFAAIRELYNRRAEEPELRRLSFCLVGVATPSDLIRDTRTTPFNIGHRIEINDFKEKEVVPLAGGMGRGEKRNLSLLKRVIYWTGGHPYLTQRLCQAIADDPQVDDAADVDRLCESLFLSSRARERDDNLIFVRERILQSEVDLAGLLDLYGQLRRGKRVRDDEANPLVNVLQLSGITRAKDGHLGVRNRVYERVFDRSWVQGNMPDAELRRQRAAYRRGVIRTAIISALILAVLTFSLIYAVRQRSYAFEQESKAQEALVKLQEALLDAIAARQIAEYQRQVALKQQRLAEAEKINAQRQESIALAKTELANEQTRHARAAEEKIDRFLYDKSLILAQQLWERTNVSRMLKELNERRGSASGKDFRSFEWHYLWNQAHNDKATLDGYSDGVTSVIYSADGKLLITASGDNTINLRNLENQHQPTIISGFKNTIRSMAVSPDNRILAVATADKIVDLRDATTGRELAQLRGHTGAILSVAFSANGKWLATASADKTVKLWDIRKRVELATLFGHTEEVLSVAFSAGSDKLVTGSRDNTAKVWDLVSKNAPITLKHSGAVYSMAFSLDGKLLATASDDGEASVWGIAGQESAPAVSTRGGIGARRDLSVQNDDLRLRLRFYVGEAQAGQVVFSRDVKMLAVGKTDGSVAIYYVQKKRRANQQQRQHCRI